MSQLPHSMASAFHALLDKSGASDAERKEVIKKDYDFYFSDVIFLVEGCLFKVPRIPFERDSEVFQAMFKLPVPENAVADGSRDESPLRLDGVKKDDFCQLLKVLFPRCLRPLQSLHWMGWEQWFSVFKLSMMWQMDEIQKLAVQSIFKQPFTVKDCEAVLKLSTLSRFSELRGRAMKALSTKLQPVDRIVLARECQIAAWLLLGYQELVDRNETISEADEERLGCRTAVKLLRIRDQGRFQGYGSDAKEAIIRTAFESELKEAEYP